MEPTKHDGLLIFIIGSGIVCTQILPFADRKVVPLFEEFEKIVYKNL